MSKSFELYLSSIGELIHYDCESRTMLSHNKSIVLLDCVFFFTYVAIDNEARWSNNHYVKII